MRRTLILAALLLASASPLAAQGVLPANAAAATTVSSAATKAYALQISSGDLLSLDVFDSPDLSGKLRVDERGEITLPLGGDLEVGGLTAEQAAHKVEAWFHEKDILKDPHVSVTVLEYATQGITVMGEVKNPGVYPLLGSRGLFDLISQAGGLTQQAGGAVTVTHREDSDHPVTAKIGSNPGSVSLANLDIQPGDTIVVSHAGIVYVVGDVGRPGGFVLGNSDRLTVLQAVALAQGTNKTAALSRAKVIRKTDAGREQLPVSLKKILANNAPDEALYDGDILFVPSSAGKSALHGIEEVLPSVTSAAIFRVP
jgi:polysaccharide export outer membrane protein